ncbi:MAG: heparan-alpha-glucosaminide N-acetyltransferase [Candidatus Micrarchaeota archaeon]
MEKRLWEIDALRGIAICLMVVFHFAFDLNYLNIANISVSQMPWLLLQRITISLFLLLVGASLYLKSEKLAAQQKNINLELAKRAFFLFAVAALISLATWLIAPQQFIAFGIIHVIALSTIVAIPFLRLYKLNLLIGALLLASSFFFQLPQINTPLLLWFGFTFPGFQSLDFVPLFPWFGLILIGIFAAKLAYKENKLKINLEKPQSKIVELLQIAGRNSLLIYLLHQPILFAALKLYMVIF